MSNIPNLRAEFIKKPTDPSEILLSNGMPMSSFRPRARKIRGIVIPSTSGAYGERSPKFDVKRGGAIVIDPGTTLKEASYDLSLLTPEEEEMCHRKAMEIPEDEIRQILSETHVNRDEEYREKPINICRGAYAYMLIAEICRSRKDKSTKSADSTSQPAPTKVVQKQPQKKTTQAYSVAGSLISQLKEEDNKEQPAASSYEENTVMKKVLFEYPLPIGGRFAWQYHDVVRTENILILIADNTRKDVPIWFPEKSHDDETTLAALVHDDDGMPDTLFEVLPTGVSFAYGGKTFCLLAIEKEKPYNQQKTTESDND